MLFGDRKSICGRELEGFRLGEVNEDVISATFASWIAPRTGGIDYYRREYEEDAGIHISSL